MKKPMLGKLRVIVCLLLSLILVLPFAACDKGEGGGTGGLKISTATGTVDVGANLLLSVTGASGAVEWESDDESVATVAPISAKVDTSARVVGVKPGTAVITATSGDSSVECTVTVTAVETITITKDDGSAVPTNIQLNGQNDTVKLKAASSKEHEITWESSDPLLASVVDGLVTAVATSGTVTITAKCAGADNNTGSIKASVTVTIGSGVASSYAIPFAEDPITNPGPGKWSQWSEFDNVTAASYEDGKVTISFANNGARWVNIQLRYLPTEAEGLVPGNLYKLTFKATLSFPAGFEAAGGHVTVNGNTVYLNEGADNYSVYYIQGPAYDGDSPMSFNMMMGYQNGTPAGAWDLFDATIVLENITWTPATPEPLRAPTFSITNNVITISDSNPAGSVSKYVLSLYKDNKRVGEVTVTNNAQIDVSKIMVNGELTGKLRAIASSPRYSDSEEATSENCTVTVDNPHVEYNLQYSEGTPAAGLWAYWTENWVNFTGKYDDGIVNVTFSNNQGNWYDTQLKYKSLHNVGETYSVKLHINVDGTVTGTGRITISGSVYNLHAGDNEIVLNITEGAGDSIVIVFGVYPENTQQEIKAATVTISMEEL